MIVDHIGFLRVQCTLAAARKSQLCSIQEARLPWQLQPEIHNFVTHPQLPLDNRNFTATWHALPVKHCNSTKQPITPPKWSIAHWDHLQRPIAMWNGKKQTKRTPNGQNVRHMPNVARDPTLLYKGSPRSMLCAPPKFEESQSCTAPVTCASRKAASKLMTVCATWAHLLFP